MAAIISTVSEEEARILEAILAEHYGKPYRIYVQGREFRPVGTSGETA